MFRVFLLLLLVQPLTAVVHTDEGFVYQQVDGREPSANRVLSFTCTPADWAPGAAPYTLTVTSPDGKNTSTVSVVCQPPSVRYDLTKLFYVPVNGSLFVSSICSFPDSAAVTETTEEDAIGRLQLNSVVHHDLVQKHRIAMMKHQEYLYSTHLELQAEGIESGLQWISPKNGRAGWYAPPGRSHPRLQGGFLSALRRSACAWGGVVSTALIFSGACNEAAVPSQEDIDALKAKSAQLQAQIEEGARTALERDQANARWRGYQESVNANQNVINNQVQTQLNLTLEELDKVKTSVSVMDSRVSDIVAVTEREFNRVRSKQMETDESLLEVANALSALAQENSVLFQDLSDSLQRQQVRFMNMSQEQTTAIRRLDAYTQSGLLELQLSIRKIAGSLVRFAMQRDARAQHTRNIFDLIDDANAMGMSPWIAESIQYPVVSDTLSYTVAVFRTRYWTGPNSLRQTTIEIRCRTRHITSVLGIGQQADDILNSLGPAGCTPGTDCNCFWDVRTTVPCTAVSTLYSDPSDGNYFENATSAFRTAEILGPTTCTSGLVPSEDTGLRLSVTNASQVPEVFDLIVGAAHPGYTNFAYHIHEILSGKSLTVNRNADDPTTLTIADIAKPRTSTGFARGFKSLLSDQQYALSFIIEPALRAIQGVLPNSVTVQSYPFSNVNGTPAVCTDATFMAYKPGLAPVYQWTIGGTTAEAIVTVTDDTTGISRVIRQRTAPEISDVANGLPGTMLTVGNPLGSDSNSATGDPFGDTVYNINPAEIGTGIPSVAHKGKVTYRRCFSSNEDECTPASWKAQHGGVVFSHPDASNVAGLYARTLRFESSARRGRTCAGTGALDDNGALCSILQRFDIVPANSLNTSVYAQPVGDGSYTGQYYVPAGSVVSQFVSACPITTLAGTGREKSQVAFQNPSSRTVTFSVVFDDSACCETSRIPVPLALAGSASRLYEIAPCTSSCASTTISLLDANGDACPGTQNFPVEFPELLTIANGALPPDAPTVRRITSSVRQEVFIGSYNSNVEQTRLNVAMNVMLQTLATDLRVFEGPAGGEYLGMLYNIGNLTLRAAERAANNSRNSNYTSTGLFNESETRARLLLDEANADMEILREQNIAAGRIATERNAINAGIGDLMVDLSKNITILDERVFNMTLATGKTLVEFINITIGIFADIREAALERNIDLGDVGADIINGLERAGGLVGRLVDEVLDKLPKFPEDLFEGFGKIVQIVVLIAMIGFGAVVGFKIVQCSNRRRARRSQQYNSVPSKG